MAITTKGFVSVPTTKEFDNLVGVVNHNAGVLRGLCFITSLGFFASAAYIVVDMKEKNRLEDRVDELEKEIERLKAEKAEE